MALHHVEAGEKVQLSSLTLSDDAKRAALVKTDAFEAVHLQLRAGDRIAPHSVSGYAIIQCLEGSLVLEMATPVELGRGDWVYLDRGQTHGVLAPEDSSVLLTILFD